jgi:hypothetical protein
VLLTPAVFWQDSRVAPLDERPAPDSPGISFVVPCYNESTQILRVLTTMPVEVDRVYVIDDASRDNTAKGECPGLDRKDLHALADRLMTNPLYVISGRRRSGLHYLKSELYREERNLDGTLRHLEAAYEAEPDIGAIALIVGTMLSAGLRDEARTFLEQTQKDLPLNPVLRSEWLKIIGQLRQLLDRQ